MRTTVSKIKIELIKKYQFESTFLLQYDAMTNEKMMEIILESKDERMEIGIWIEMVREMAEAAGIVWRGRWDWDYHVAPGFLPSYSKDERSRLIDVIMKKYHDIFGEYPKSAGAWLLDSYSIEYMKEKYGIQAACICREQWGTDGYTLWGGYYNGAYYPSKKHFLHPAQDPECQISVPVFRMLGPDPIYCYSEKLPLTGRTHDYGLYTLEPGYDCGYSREWVEWYFRHLCEEESMGFAFTQTGQENSFGWELIGKGFPMQAEILKRLHREEKICVRKLKDIASAFSEKYAITPATSYSALDDWSVENRQSVWFQNRYYRLNIYCDGTDIWLRDLHLFDQNAMDPYLNTPCKTANASYSTIPVLDPGMVDHAQEWNGILIGKGRILSAEQSGEALVVRIGTKERSIELKMEEKEFIMSGKNEKRSISWARQDGTVVLLCH